MSTVNVRAPRRILKAARVAVDLQQDELANLAGVSANTVYNFEARRLKTRESTRVAIQQALEKSGVVFTNGDKPGFYLDKAAARAADLPPREPEGRLPRRPHVGDDDGAPDQGT